MKDTFDLFVCLVVVVFFLQDSGDIHFLASIQDWYNPYNWQDIASLASSIILHTDNVPCVHDTAVFPQVIKALSHLTLSIQCMNFGYPYQFSWKHNLYNGKRQLSLCFTSKCALHFEWKIKHVDLKSLFCEAESLVNLTWRFENYHVVIFLIKVHPAQLHACCIQSLTFI